MLFTLFYISSVIYCLYKLAKRADNKNLGGNIGNTPALDTLMVVILAPFLATMDLLISIIYVIKKML